LFFELERNWTGILIEPVPSLFQEILLKNRNVFSINVCIANEKPTVAKFKIFEALSGRLDKMHEAHSKRIDKEGTTKMRLIYVPCFSLVSILKAMNVQKVDYFSLDVEGGEYDVLTGIKFDKITIDTFSIEHNGFLDNDTAKRKYISYLEKKNYKNIREDFLDVYFKRTNL